MDFKNIDELQDFLIWASQNGVQKIKVGQVEAEFVHPALRELGNVGTSVAPEASKPPTKEVKSLPDDEEMLFWSSRP